MTWLKTGQLLTEGEMLTHEPKGHPSAKCQNWLPSIWGTPAQGEGNCQDVFACLF